MEYKHMKRMGSRGMKILRHKFGTIKLRDKMTAGMIFILLTAMVCCCIFLISDCRKAIIQDVKLYTEQENEDFRDTFVFQTAKLSSVENEFVRNSGIRYYFSQLAQSAGGESEYVLLRDDETIYNNSGINVSGVLEIKDKVAARRGNQDWNATGKVVHTEDGDFYVTGMSASVADEMFIVGVVRNMTGSMDMVRVLALRCGLVCTGVAALAVLLTVLFLRKSLMPIEWLNENAKKIASGEYDCRIAWKRRDELGTLGKSFNSMAQSVKQHICQVETVAKDQNMLLHALAHEMRTPVTAISGYAYALQYARLSKDQREEAAAFIYSESLRLERLTKKITELVRMDSAKLEKENIRVTELFTQLTQVQQLLCEKTGRVEEKAELASDAGNGAKLQFPKETVCCRCEKEDEIYGDSDLLLMLLTNLIDNAYKAGADRVMVSFEEGILSVTDNGHGILPEQLEKIMQPFYQGDFSRNQEGFGLGLALCQKIAALHGSELKVSSTVGEGSRFWADFKGKRE